MKKLILFLLPTLIYSQNQYSGKVGINTTTPDETLTVNGTISIKDLPLGDSTDFLIVVDQNGKLKKISQSSLSSNHQCPSFIRSMSTGHYLVFTSSSSIPNPNDNIVIQGKTFISAGTWISNNTYYFTYTGINGAININNSFTVNFGTLSCNYTN